MSRLAADFGEHVLRLASAVLALLLGHAPRRYWADLERVAPVTRMAGATGLATLALGFAIGFPAFLQYATARADQDVELALKVLASASQAAPASAAAGRFDDIARMPGSMAMFTLFGFLFFTPVGLFATYLGLSGFFRAVSASADDARGDPILTAADRVARRLIGRTRAHSARMARERLEGPEMPDRLITGERAGLDADVVVVSSRRKPGWEPGTFVITEDKWYRLGTPVDHESPAGLRTLYPLTELRVNEVLRKGVRYELPRDPEGPAEGGGRG